MSSIPSSAGQSDEFAPAWRPEAGDHLIGRITGISSRDGGFGEYPIITVDTEVGELAVHAVHKVLQRELARLRPEVGERLQVMYLGKRDTADGRVAYHKYTVGIEGRSPAPLPWEMFLDESAAGAATSKPSATDTDGDDAIPF